MQSLIPFLLTLMAAMGSPHYCCLDASGTYFINITATLIQNIVFPHLLPSILAFEQPFSERFKVSPGGFFGMGVCLDRPC